MYEETQESSRKRRRYIPRNLAQFAWNFEGAPRNGGRSTLKTSETDRWLASHWFVNQQQHLIRMTQSVVPIET